MQSGFEEKCKKFTGTEMKSPAEYGPVFAEKLGGKPFFHGDELGVCDLSVYGSLLPFAEAQTQGALDFLENGHIRAWYDRVRTKVGEPNFS